MAKMGSLLLLLALAVTPTSIGGETLNVSTCPIRFYGHSFSFLDVTFNADSSMDFCFKDSMDGTAQDCLFLNNGGGADTVSMDIDLTSGTSLTADLPSINYTTDCQVSLKLKDDVSTYVQIIFYPCDVQGALSFYVYSLYGPTLISLTAVSENSQLDSWTFRRSKGRGTVYMDISSCRTSGVIIKPESSWIFEDTCTTADCDEYSDLETTSCTSMEVCQGNNVCIPRTYVCTVTGPTVIDFFYRVHYVPDQCVYTLMTHSSGEFELSAVFRERRRKDVLFLDHLIIFLPIPNGKIELEQGGRVQVDGQILMLNASSQEIHGVKLSKDETGITAKLPSSSMTIFFDGNTAHMSGPADSYGGLCGDPEDSNYTTTISDMKNATSDFGCDIQNSDTFDDTIDCERSTEHCNLMNQAPFTTGCHNYIDPEPFIEACTNTTCQYPAVDDLNCQFLEAYAKTCELVMNLTLEDWRADADCSDVLQANCRDQYCSDHEFCGEKLGETRCLCRASFASTYKPTNAFGEPTVCTENSATVTLAACLLWDKGIDYSALHLNDQNCTGLIDTETHMVTFSFNISNSCGSKIMMNDDHVTFNNIITTRDGIISDPVEIDFSCSYMQPDTKSLTNRFKRSPVFQQMATGLWNYSVTMSSYTDPGHTHLIESITELQMNQRIWVELKAEGLDNAVVTLVTDSCWATNDPDPNFGLRHDLIINGCPNPADQTVEVEANGVGPSTFFTFHMFEFVGNWENNKLYLYCQLELCPMDQYCIPSCDGDLRRRRRSSSPRYAYGHSSLVTMVWNV